MARVEITWQPVDTDEPETLTADLDERQRHTLRAVLALKLEARGNAIIWLNAQDDSTKKWGKTPLRLHRIRAFRVLPKNET